MKGYVWTILGVAVVVIILVLATRNVREHLTGQTIPSLTDALEYPDTPGSAIFDAWFIPNFPQGGFDTVTYVQIAKATLWFVWAYGPKYTAATAPLSKDEFYKDFLPVYNGELTVMIQNSVPAPSAVAVTDPSALANNAYADLVYIYYYGPTSKTPYVAPTPGSLAPLPKPPAPTPTSSMTNTSAPPAASSSPNQPLTFYIPQPCKDGYKSFPGGTVDLRCFD